MMIEYFIETDVQYPRKFQEFHNDLPSLSKKIEIEMIEKIVVNLHHISEYVIHSIIKI